MKISVILGHPKKESFNHAISGMIVHTLKNNKHEVIFHDLYDEKFDPLLPQDEITSDVELNPVIKKYCNEISETEGIVIVHPNWWGHPPAILKGWVDRVLRMGIAYKFGETESGEGIPLGLLKAKTAIIFNTSNTPDEKEIEAFGDPLETFWKKCVFNFCGIKNVYRKNYSVVVMSTLEQRKLWLKDVEKIINEHFPKK